MTKGKEKIEPIYKYRDNSNIVKWIKRLLISLALINVIMLASSFMERQLLQDFQSGGVYQTEEEIYAAADASDSRQVILAYIYLAIYLTTAISVGRWIIYSGRNSRALGAKGMEISPGWAVGYYFIPILTLWKPYVALREIFQTSTKPNTGSEDWSKVKRPRYFAVWWTLWIIASILGQIIFRFGMKADEMEELLAVNMLDICSSIIDLPLIFVFSMVVLNIYKLQKEAYEKLGSPKPETTI